MMNVAPPVPMPVVSASLGHDSFPQPERQSADSMVRPDAQAVGASEFYKNGLGWSTDVTHEATRFIMPAYPVRFTQLEVGTSIAGTTASGATTGTGSIYKLPTGTDMHDTYCATSVSPALVSRILSMDAASRSPFYTLRALDSSGHEEDADVSSAQPGALDPSNPLHDGYDKLT
eukprot:6204687-Pleurochrysis_carterae.AAC.1